MPLFYVTGQYFVQLVCRLLKFSAGVMGTCRKPRNNLFPVIDTHTDIIVLGLLK